MIRRVLALLTLLARPVSAQLKVPHVFAVDRNVSLRIWVPEGTVRVETWDRDSVRVAGTAASHAHFFGGGAGRGAKMGIENDDVKESKLAHGDVVVTVPRAAHVWVKMTDGTVTAANTTGELEVITVTGTIDVQDASGVVSIETIDANVTLARVSGAIRVRGGGGRVAIAQIRGTLTLATVSGAADVAGTSLQDARIETIGGRITLRGSVSAEALVDLETHDGPITLFLDKQSLPSLSLFTRGGTIKNPFESMKGGAGKITVRSFKGDITVIGVSGIDGKQAGKQP